MALTDAELRIGLEEDGYVVLPGLLPEDVISRLRSIVDGFFASGRGVVFNLGRAQPNAAVECPDLSFLFSDPRVTDSFRRLLGTSQIKFTGQCDIHSNIISTFHRDTGQNHDYFAEPCFVDDCRLYKMGIYLQDHLDGKGLTVHPGSHREPDGPTRPALTLRTRAGDAIVFDVRIVHRGQAPSRFEAGLHKANRTLNKLGQRLLGRSRSAGEPSFGYDLREVIRRLGGGRRKLAVFFTFGPRNRFTDQFASASIARQLSQYGDGRCAYPEGMVEALRAADVEVHEPVLEDARR